MENFDILQIQERVWRILDSEKDTFYLIEGNEKAAVIDTGVTEGVQLLPMLRTLTQKPLVLILTHAHIDRFHHMDEFDTVFMCHDELTMPGWFLHEMMAGKDLKLDKTIPIDTDSRIDLGDRVLKICKVPGHTPGSAVIYDARDNFVYTGDAIGSGCGVWMQLPGSTSLAVYEQSLIHLMKWLMERTSSPIFWGGHCLQRWQSSRISGDNPLSMGLLADMIDLVHGLIEGSIQGWHIDLPPEVRMREACSAAYGRAEITYNPDLIN